MLFGNLSHQYKAIRVADHGSGIGDNPERLFRRFARDDDGTAHPRIWSRACARARCGTTLWWHGYANHPAIERPVNNQERLRALQWNCERKNNDIVNRQVGFSKTATVAV
ncbi:hypothetical protein [Bifidobacterium goeldii]|uniref:hypothetical protein n=1 Tax=Bifidobacterium goeldii TaxID=2306975 RepID=UPI001F495F9B|nr:hypothetical protein [Bifidobacterium goeldii]